MSRLGKKPIDIPDNVKVTVSGRTVAAEGPEGKGSVNLHPEVSAAVDDRNRVVVSCKGATKVQKMLWGTWRSHVANLLHGVSKGYQKDLEINGVGYSAKVQAGKLVMVLGYSHPVEMSIPEGLKVTCPSPSVVSVRGVDKRLVGQFAAEIRSKRPVEPYNLKGIKYRDEVVRRKAGKTFVTGAT